LHKSGLFISLRVFLLKDILYKTGKTIRMNPGRKYLLVIIYALLATVIFINFTFSIEYNLSVGYIIAVLLTLFSGKKIHTIIVGIAGLISVLLGIWFIHWDTLSPALMINDLTELIGISLAMFIVLLSKKTQKDAFKNNQQFESLFNFSTIGIILINQKGKIIKFNPFAEKLFAYKSVEVIGKKIDILIPKKNVGKEMGVGGAKDLYAQKKDGKRFPVEVSRSAYNIDGEKFEITFVIDITIRKQDEIMLLEQKTALEKSAAAINKMNQELEQQVKDRTKILKETLSALQNAQSETIEALNFKKAILDNAGASIIVTDTSGIVKLFNPAAEDFLGYNQEEVIDKFNVTQFHLSEEIQAKSEELSKFFKQKVNPGFEVFTIKSNRNLHDENEWNFVRKDGTHFQVSLNITAMRDAKNLITGYLGVAIDITDLKNHQKRLQEALAKEKELGDLKSRFVTMASHEFRTPLSTILSSSFILEQYNPEDEDNEKRNKHLHRIKGSVAGMKNILEDFLSLEKLEEDAIYAKMTEVSLHDFLKEIENTIDDLQQDAKAGQVIKFSSNLNEPVRIDLFLLRNILINLLSNAIKFSPQNSVIHVGVTSREKDICIFVKDNGIGISEEDQQHLFTRFFRAKNAGAVQGTGLGLHIVTRYLKLMNGNIEIDSKLNRGTTFTISIPK
jgi:PAS domain S-box-containing protein